MTASWQESDDRPRRCVEKQRQYSADRGLYSQGYRHPSGQLRFWELDRKEDRMPKDWCLPTVVLEKIPWTARRSKQSILWEINMNTHWKDWCCSWSSSILVTWYEFIWKVPEAGKAWGQKRASEDEMARWHHWCNGDELGQTLGDGEGQGGLVCCSPWGHKESNKTGWLNSNKSVF